MGWNDFSRLGFIRLPGFMKKAAVGRHNKLLPLTLALTFASLLLTSAAFIQGDTADSSEHRLKVKFPLNILHHYKLTEVTTVARTFSDSTTREYSREIEYYYTLKQLSLPSNEFVEIDARVDSVRYLFKENGVEKKVFTEDEKYGEGGLTEDIRLTVLPKDRNFMMTFSPYGDLAKITSPQIDEVKRYFTDHAQELVSDTMRKITWFNQLSDYNLQYICNVQKLLLPMGPVKRDSVWKSPMIFRIDMKNYVDTLKVWIADIKVGEYIIESEGHNPKFFESYGLFNGVKYPLTIDSTKGITKYAIKIDPFGCINKSEGFFSARIFARSNKERFSDSVTVRSNTELLGRYRW